MLNTADCADELLTNLGIPRPILCVCLFGLRQARKCLFKHLFNLRTSWALYGSVRGTQTVFVQQMLVDDFKNAFNAEFQRFENFFAVVPASLWILEFGFQKFEKAFKLDASELEH